MQLSSDDLLDRIDVSDSRLIRGSNLARRSGDDRYHPHNAYAAATQLTVVATQLQ
jgi:hypothetical protein